MTVLRIVKGIFEQARESETGRTLKIKQCKTRTKTHTIPVNSYSVWEESGNKKLFSNYDARRQNELQTQNLISTADEVVLIPFLRVWSWLRTNAGGVPNTCKSNGDHTDGGFGQRKYDLSGGRASNAWVTCLSEGDNSWKRLLIPHNVLRGHPWGTKDLSLKDGLASD